jgi:hypothetical protein
LGTGDGSFSAPITAFFGPGWHGSALVADLNGDGNQDFAAANSDYWNVSVLLGDGTGNLAAGGSFAIDASPWSVIAGDVNGDLTTDLVTANNYNNSVSVLLGNGAGAFATVQSYTVGSWLTSVVLGDFNNDTTLDIATANYGSDDVRILLGRGDGTFAPPEQFATGPRPQAVAIADFNGDGWIDVATANPSNDTVSVLINNQSWSPPPLPPPSSSVGDATITEGNTGTTNATFTVTLSKAVGADVTVHYETANGSALAGSDYIAASGTVTIPAGQTSRTFTVAVKGDRVAEPTEYFTVNLSSPTNATIGDGQGTGTILDEDTSPSISISDVTKYEGNSGTTKFVFTVSLSAASDSRVTVNFATSNGSAKKNDNDYVANSGKLTFAPGQTSKTITISVKGDKKKESDETFFVTLTKANGALIDDDQGVGTILNDDGLARRRDQLTFAAAVDAAFEDWMTSRPRKRWW